MRGHRLRRPGEPRARRSGARADFRAVRRASEEERERTPQVGGKEPYHLLSRIRRRFARLRGRH